MTLANHNKHKLPNEPIRTRSKYVYEAISAKKKPRMTKTQLVLTYFLLVEKVEAQAF